MNNPPSQGRKPLWILLGVLATFSVTLRTGAPWGIWVYAAVGALVAAYWFWNDRTPEKGERWDIAVALPFLALFWPALALALPFMKHFRDGT